MLAHIVAENGFYIDDPTQLSQYFQWLVATIPTVSDALTSSSSVTLENQVLKEPYEIWYGESDPHPDTFIIRFINDVAAWVPALATSEVGDASPPQFSEDSVHLLQDTPDADVQSGHGPSWSMATSVWTTRCSRTSRAGVRSSQRSTYTTSLRRPWPPPPFPATRSGPVPRQLGLACHVDHKAIPEGRWHGGCAGDPRRGKPCSTAPGRYSHWQHIRYTRALMSAFRCQTLVRSAHERIVLPEMCRVRCRRRQGSAFWAIVPSRRATRRERPRGCMEAQSLKYRSHDHAGGVPLCLTLIAE